MSTTHKPDLSENKELSAFIGKVISFNTSLKMYHWHVTGLGSYATHIALDQALDTLLDVTDRIAETSYALNGALHITVPETKLPDNIVKHVSDFYMHVEASRKLFHEPFSQSILDDYQEGLQQLVYRLTRLE